MKCKMDRTQWIAKRKNYTVVKAKWVLRTSLLNDEDIAGVVVLDLTERELYRKIKQRVGYKMKAE
jgi:hypothetical protein